jgi:acetyl-CoA carboxylase biotin carboxylase subunit
VGPAPARDSYLNVASIVAAATTTRCEAVHPGWGFLAENAAFARACEDNGLEFVGPTPESIELMGDKARAKQTVRAAGLPLVPGSDGMVTLAEARAIGQEIGYPLLLKASAGGGGRGMRLVAGEEELERAYGAAAAEAGAAFGYDGLYAEKALVDARHVEIQVVGDGNGRVLTLGERDCSIQRRHQKVIEEAPGNRISEELRARMGEAAVAAAKAVGYVGAGTCEFLVDARDRFYFLEMNTRVQVEHAITEAVTGVDIVKTMIRIAAGEPMPFAQDDVAISGHAIEARIYAEDPDRNFAPSPGEIIVYRPPDGIGIRVDSGVYQGATVTVNYDPMVAKLIAWGRDRPEAIDRLRRALEEFVVKGIKTSIPFHLRVLRHPRFVEGRYDTGFIDQHMDGGKGAPEPESEERRVALMLGAIAAYRRDKERAERAAYRPAGGGGGDPWREFGRRSQMRGSLR